jgi:predicted nucleic acid-binding Zn ribbon protein
VADEPARLGAAIDRLLGHLGAPPARVVSTLESVWPEVAGPGLASCSRPIELRDGTLVVACSEPAWASQLRWMEAELCQRLSAHLEGVAVVAIRVRHVGPGEGPTGPRW